MAYLNANIPVLYSQIRREYLYDLKEHHGEVEDCIIFGLASITGRPILFHAIMENGAVFYRLPISAFVQRGFDPKEIPRRRLDELELWNCFSYYPSVTSFDILDGQSGNFFGSIGILHIPHVHSSYNYKLHTYHHVLSKNSGNHSYNFYTLSFYSSSIS